MIMIARGTASATGSGIGIAAAMIIPLPTNSVLSQHKGRSPSVFPLHLLDSICEYIGAHPSLGLPNELPIF